MTDIEREYVTKLFYDDTPLHLKLGFIKKLKAKAQLVKSSTQLDTKTFKLHKLEVYKYKNITYKIEYIQNLKTQKQKINIWKIECVME